MEQEQQSISKLFEEDYLSADNKRELDYWAPLANIACEFIELLQSNKTSIEEVSKELNVPVESLQRFDSLEEIPEYDLVEKLCNYFNQRLSVSLYGAYTATLSSVYHEKFDALAKSKNRDTKTLLEEILETAVLEELKEGG